MCLLLLGGRAAAVDDIGTEEEVAELLVTPRTVKETGAAGRRWAVLPLVGYGPRTSGVIGVKYKNRDLLAEGLTFDAQAAIAVEGQRKLALRLSAPHLDDDRYLCGVVASYDLDPQFEFFGLGNNDAGPDPISTHRRERVQGQGMCGWRPWHAFALTGAFALRHYDIGHGDRDDDRPFTIDAFPNLPGIDGGLTTPLAVSAVLNTRDALIRPTRGWRGIVKFAWDPPGGDFEYTRVVGDLGYLYPLGEEGRHVLSARVDGAVILGPRRDVPFWELEMAGGDDSIRGFFPDRFSGRSRLFLNTEYRARMFAFTFFDLWLITVEGALFADVGRVFIEKDEIDDDLAPNDDLNGHTQGGVQIGGGPGIRFLLSQAIVARIDVGFSKEETGVVYLSFGHTF